MQKVLRKRVFRDLVANKWRYLALGLLISLSMYLVVSMMAAADTVITQVKELGEENKIEDGNFTLFVPLSAKEKEELVSRGVTLEEQFYLDYKMKDTSIIRIYSEREKINLLTVDDGQKAKEADEIVIEERYAAKHDLECNDTIMVGGKEYTITGIGSVPDYDAVYRNLSDSSVDSLQFGLGFVTKDSYAELKKMDASDKSEEYVYAYRLSKDMTNRQLKKQLREMEVSSDDIADKYFQEYWEETGGKRAEVEDGIDEVSDGADKIADVLKKLKGNNGDLRDGADAIFQAYLASAQEELVQAGYIGKLTEENYEEELNIMADRMPQPAMQTKIKGVVTQLNELKSFKKGITQYTDGVKKTYKGAKKLAEGMEEFEKEAEELLDENFDVTIEKMTQFVEKANNPRIEGSAKDQIMNKIGGMIAGILLMVLFAYVVSVFVIHSIEKESSIIGALYALGAKKKDLLLHYITLPVVITFIAGLIGTITGFSSIGMDVQMESCINYFSFPDLEKQYAWWMIVYGVVMPPVLAAVVNCFIIQKKLSQPALKLIRNEQKQAKISHINFGNMGFVNRFRFRQTLREFRSSLAVVFGIFIALLLVMLGMNTYVLCNNLKENNKKDTKYEYMYTYKYPQEKVPDGGEGCFAKGLTKMVNGYEMEAMVLGVDADNPYFDVDVKKSKSNVVISSAMAQKFGLDIGDKVVLTDKNEEVDYAFTVDEIYEYSTTFFVFMDIGNMRELFDESEDYINVVFSGKKLDIPSGRLYSTTTKSDIEKSSEVFIDNMGAFITMLLSASVLILFVVMYLMMKVMIDRSAFHISLVKVFGYRKKELKKLYLSGNFYVVAIGSVICIPLAKLIMDSLFPVLVANVACGIDIAFAWYMYLIPFASIVAVYWFITKLLVRRIYKILPAEVLKNRE